MKRTRVCLAVTCALALWTVPVHAASVTVQATVTSELSVAEAGAPIAAGRPAARERQLRVDLPVTSTLPSWTVEITTAAPARLAGVDGSSVIASGLTALVPVTVRDWTPAGVAHLDLGGQQLAARFSATGA